MFVDEGFGSLDEESLNQAVKALEGLAGWKLSGRNYFSCAQVKRAD